MDAIRSLMKSVTGFWDEAWRADVLERALGSAGGVGGQLLSEIERRLAERGWSVVIADVWADAEAFYRSHGWAPPPVVSMRRRLTEAAAPPVTG